MTEKIWNRKKKPLRCWITILCEFGRAEYGGDPEGLFGASLKRQVGRQVGAAVEILFTAGQAQVQSLVTEGGILIALETQKRHRRPIKIWIQFGLK